MLIQAIDKTDIYSYLRVAFGVILIAAAAQIVIPIQPVPITLHTVAAILIALLYKPNEALSSWALYIILGLIGFPIFTNFNSGPAKIIGPSGGYYIGMTISAFLISYFRTSLNINLKKTYNIFLLILLAQSIIYFYGVARLAQFIGLEKALYSGFFVFIPSGIVKTIILSFIFKLVYEKYS